MPAIYSKPALMGTSNTRQGTREGKIRRSGRNYHGSGHWDCDASEHAKEFMVASSPGLSMDNWHSQTILGGDADGLSIQTFLQSLMNDPVFNGHLVFWMLDNDNKFVNSFGYDKMNLAAKEYLNRMSKFIRGLKFTRLYLITMPMRQSDFKANLPAMSDFLLKAKFNKEMRTIFANDNVIINGIPTSLIDLDIIWPEYTFQEDRHFCTKEISKKYLPPTHRYYDPFPGVHYNARCYKEILKYIWQLLKSHDGLSRKLTRGSNPTMFNDVQIWQSGTLTGLDENLRTRQDQPTGLDGKFKTDETKRDCNKTVTVTITCKTQHKSSQLVPLESTDSPAETKKGEAVPHRHRWNHSKFHVTCTFDLFRLFRHIEIE